MSSYNVNWMTAKRFGSIEARESIIKRDDYKCTSCKMTRRDHQIKYGKDLTVNHIDGNGRYSNLPNNEPSNLETLCLPCHGKKDSKRSDYSKRRSYKGSQHPNYKITPIEVNLIKKFRKSGLTLMKISEILGISYSSVHRLGG